MNLNITLIQNGFILSLQTKEKGTQTLFFPTKELLKQAVEEIFNSIQQSPLEDNSQGRN